MLIKWKLNQPMAPMAVAKWEPNENLMESKWGTEWEPISEVA